MNKEYIYSNGKAIVVDENYNMTMVDYCDNLGDVLVQENIIEEMLHRKKELEEELSNKGSLKKFSKLRLIVYILLVTLVSMCLANGLEYLTIFLGIDMTLFPVIIGLMPIVPVSIFLKTKYEENQSTIREFRSKEVELELLNKELIEQKEYLQSLEKDKTSSHSIMNLSNHKVKDLERLRLLRAWLTFYRELGYFEDKYLKYYQRGTLEEKLEEEYSDEAVDFAMEYFREFGPRLIKSRK